jgi:hypothetical protein
MKCRRDAGVMSDPVGVRANGVERAMLSAGKAESRLGLVGNTFDACVLLELLS